MKKYIIKNCPAFVLMRTGTNTTYFDMCGNAKGRIACKDCTDCPLKQIVEKCKKVQFECDKELINGNYPDKYKYFKSGRADLGQEICDLLEVEEVEG